MGAVRQAESARGEGVWRRRQQRPRLVTGTRTEDPSAAGTRPVTVQVRPTGHRAQGRCVYCGEQIAWSRALVSWYHLMSGRVRCSERSERTATRDTRIPLVDRD